MVDDTVDLWALDQVHFQQQGSRCRMWVPPEAKDPVVYHHPTRKSVGYFAAVHLRDDRRFGRRFVLRLPERHLNLEAVYRLDRQEPQRSARQRLHVVGEPGRPWTRFVLDACGNLGCPGGMQS